ILGHLESKTQYSVHPYTRKYGLLQNHFTLSARENTPAQIGVLTLGILTYHYKINIARFFVRQRTRHPRHQTHWPQINILIEITAKLQQGIPQGNMIGYYIGPTYSPKDTKSTRLNSSHVSN